MSTTKFLFDALTPKQARLAAVLKNLGREKGVEIVITCREYFHLRDVLDFYNVEYNCFGGYGTTTYDKLIKGLERQIKLAEVAAVVDGMLSFPSPDAARSLFGLGKPLIVLNDTPHAIHVNKLVIPLAEVLVVPQATPVEVWKPYCPKRIVTFNSVFEYLWTSRFKPQVEVVEKLGLRPGEYVVFRPEESYASYYKWKFEEVRHALVEAVRKEGYVVVNIPRYIDQYIDGALNITKAIDHLQLAYFSAGVISGGATMATEAALLGVPSLSYFPESYYVDEYLQRLGAPLYRCRGLDCIDVLKEMLRHGKTTPLRMEDPAAVVFETALGVVTR
ncbi:MAG: DUF354 domain-containing protein [Pyrobaculum sp.]